MIRQTAFPHACAALFLLLLSSTTHANLILQPVDIGEYDFSTATLNTSFPMLLQLGPTTKQVAAEYELQGIASLDSAELDLTGSAIVLSPFLMVIETFVGNGVVEAPGDFVSTGNQIFSGFVDDQTLLKFDVTQVVQDSLDAGNDYIGFRFKDDTDSTLRFNSAPLLNVTVNALPEPAVISLIGLGLAGIGYRQRRRSIA